jgi:hypothetical protein
MIVEQATPLSIHGTLTQMIAGQVPASQRAAGSRGRCKPTNLCTSLDIAADCSTQQPARRSLIWPVFHFQFAAVPNAIREPKQLVRRIPLLAMDERFPNTSAKIADLFASGDAVD